MGVPQRRERVFIIGLRNDFELPKLELMFCESKIRLGEFGEWEPHTRCKKKSRFGDVILKKNEVANTILGTNDYFYEKDFQKPTTQTLCQIGSYPIDYKFKEVKPKYLIGMSVPPVMTAQIANQINIQWLSKSDGKTYKNN